MKKKSPVAPVVVPAKPDIYADRLAQLSPEEKAHLRQLITSGIYVKLLRIVNVMKPSPHCSRGGSGERDMFSDARANARLGELRGWEMYEAAIYLALHDAPKTRQEAKDTFPDEGRADADWTLGKKPDTK